MTQPNQAQRHNELLSAALAYAGRGLYLVPLHEPLFDDTGKCCGCSCEAYKRSASNKARLENKGQRNRFDPNFKCRTPGKHPRLFDWETEASNDPAQIKAWWHKWPTANIGIAAGKSGLITFDRDTYKQIFGDDSALFTQADKETATQISQNGGEHLVYQMPAGKAYTNANSTLPKGIDIRGAGGMFVVEPSVGPTGNQWTWEDGYSILERDPRPLPQGLQDILDAAHAAHTPAKAVTFTTPTTERIELIRWKIGKEVRALINAPGNGDRSKNDMKVAVSLCYAGATDDEILSVFEHYPIGARGKYAEAGQPYLAHTVGSARAFALLHPRPDVGPTIAAARLWIKTHSFEEHIPQEFKKPRQTKDGEKPWVYITDSTDTKIADAILDVMEVRGKLAVNVGLKRLAKHAGLNSTKTVSAALARLHGWLIEVTPDEQGTHIALCEHSRFEQNAPPLSVSNPPVFKGVQSSEIDSNEYSPHKADEAFLSGTSRLMRQRFALIAQTMDVTIKQAKEIDTDTFAALGETCLRLRDAHVRCGDMTASEAAEEIGKKLSAVRSAYRKMEAHGLVEAEREGPRGPKVYTFISEFWQKVDELTPSMRTFHLSDQREDKRLESAQQWAKRGEALATADEEEKKVACQRRFAQLARQRVPLLATLHPELSLEDIEGLAYKVADYKRKPELTAQIRTERSAQRIEHRDDVTMIRELAESFSDIETPLEDVFNQIMKFGVFDQRMVRDVLQSARQMQNYETVEDLRKRMRAEDLALPHLMINTTPSYGHNQMALAGAA